MAGVLLQQWLGEQRALVTAIVLTILALLLVRRRSTNKPNLPPSPWKLPIIGNLHQLGRLPHRSLHQLSLKHGPIMLLQLGRVPYVVVSSARLAQEFLKTHDLNFASRPVSKAANELFYNSVDILFSPYGEYWRQIRKICVVELLSERRVQSFRFAREEEVALLVEKIWRSCNPKGLVKLRSMFHSLAHNMISRIALGEKYSESKGQGNSFSEAAGQFDKLLGAFHVGDHFPSMGWIDSLTGLVAREKRIFKIFDAFFEQVIDDHLDRNTQGSEHEDLVDVLLQVQKDSTLSIPLTRNNLKAVIMDMFLAGTDTTWITLEWAMAELVKNTDAMKKAQEEVRRVAGGKSRVEESDVYQMDYLKSVIKETLRLHPVAPLLVPRECVKDVEIQGYSITAKTRVFVNVWAIARDPNSWDGTNEFKPERFMNSSIDVTGHDFQLIPFGAGRRICPGATFAIYFMELVLANLLHKFNWELPDGIKPEKLDMSEELGITLHKKLPLVLFAMPCIP